jgi:hypothetical protein
MSKNGSQSINISSCDDEKGGVNGYVDPHPPLGICVEETVWGLYIPNNANSSVKNI